ncbi:hypothetical protein CCAX7_28510 [Capsulimonas corticalis]|uniref:Uncharacterized protein n=1 Tax=Capsulimonas corticalis TaxID=2219043 RepID=A0A402CTA5_9BACT|nr:hypothetical protein [Capsulimonas corticalis]BDI30800.1 hypothetical protein CCAX7_28510 [Capsulimonas corticalis]
MNAWRVFSLVGTGGLMESMIARGDRHTAMIWAVITLISVTGWLWTTAFGAASQIGRRIAHAVTGRPLPLPATDPKALAAEIAALNAQIAQLRDTATSFDVSFDQTLARMDERLRRVEQQSSYINVGR